MNHYLYVTYILDYFFLSCMLYKSFFYMLHVLWRVYMLYVPQGIDPFIMRFTNYLYTCYLYLNSFVYSLYVMWILVHYMSYKGRCFCAICWAIWLGVLQINHLCLIFFIKYLMHVTRIHNRGYLFIYYRLFVCRLKIS